VPVLVVVVFFRAEDGIRDRNVTGVQTCALPILLHLFLQVVFFSWSWKPSTSNLFCVSIVFFSRFLYRHLLDQIVRIKFLPYLPTTFLLKNIFNRSYTRRYSSVNSSWLLTRCPTVS